MYTLDKDASPLVGTAARGWSLGTVEQTQSKAAVDYGEMD